MSPGSRPIHGTRPASISTMPTTAMTTPTMTRARPTSDMASLEKAALPAWRRGRLPLQVHVALAGDPPTRRRAHHEANFQKIRLHQFRERLGLVVDRRRDGLDTDRTAAIVLDDGGQESSIEPVEAAAVHTLFVERVARDRGRDDAAARHLGVIAHPGQQTIPDPR